MQPRSDDVDTRVVPLDLDEPPPSRRASAVRPWWTLVGLAVAVWLLFSVTRVPEPALAWESRLLPPGRNNTESLVATDTGFALLGGSDVPGRVLWTTEDIGEWTDTDLPRTLTRIVPRGEDMLAYSGREAFQLSDLRSGEPTVTPIPAPESLRTGFGSGRPAFVVGGEGFLAHTVSGDLYLSTDGRPFELVVEEERWRTGADVVVGSKCRPANRTGPDLPVILATPEGFVAFIAANDPSGVWPLCEPVAWVSENGRTWERTAEATGLDEGAYIFDVAFRDGHFVAVGGVGLDEPAVWRSTDGLAWERLETPRSADPFVLVEIEAGPLGWVAVGELTERRDHIAWVSGTGECWEALPDEVASREVAVGSERIVLTDRAQGQLWVGDPAHDPLRPTCR